jgi:phosphoglycerol transferase MdoB-like AlkP superfamily enzyme
MAEYELNPAPSYLEYVTYTNIQLKDMINTILDKDPSALIIIMGDHGFRKPPVNGSVDHLFENMNAVYFSDKNYGGLYDSISGVNQFRIIFNKVFNQTFPVLKDSSILLTDKR